MARFDLCERRDGRGLVLDVQSDLLEGFNTRVVIPVLPLSESPKPAGRLNPVVDVDGEPWVLVTQFLSAVPQLEIGPIRKNLMDEQDVVTEALDMLFLGF